MIVYVVVGVDGGDNDDGDNDASNNNDDNDDDGDNDDNDDGDGNFHLDICRRCLYQSCQKGDSGSPIQQGQVLDKDNNK